MGRRKNNQSFFAPFHRSENCACCFCRGIFIPMASSDSRRPLERPEEFEAALQAEMAANPSLAGTSSSAEPPKKRQRKQAAPKKGTVAGLTTASRKIKRDLTPRSLKNLDKKDSAAVCALKGGPREIESVDFSEFNSRKGGPQFVVRLAGFADAITLNEKTTEAFMDWLYPFVDGKQTARIALEAVSFAQMKWADRDGKDWFLKYVKEYKLIPIPEAHAAEQSDGEE
jgi:hypothetical protein